MVYLGKDQKIIRGHNVTKRTNNESKSSAGLCHFGSYLLLPHICTCLHVLLVIFIYKYILLNSSIPISFDISISLSFHTQLKAFLSQEPKNGYNEEIFKTHSNSNAEADSEEMF